MNFDDLMRNALFSLLLVFAACAAPRLIAADELPEVANARASVRMWTDGAGLCSVVVIAPGHAYTATHCLEPLLADGKIDGLPVLKATQIGDTDAAKIEVPGLACPCAPLASAPAELNDRVFGVGYPHGALRILAWGTVQEMPVNGPPITNYRAALFPCAPGCSGGGVFSASGRLLGVVSMLISGVNVIIYTQVPLP